MGKRYPDDISRKAAKLYSQIKSRCKKNNKIKLHWDLKDFISWYKLKKKECHYCHISEGESPKFKAKRPSKKNTRGLSLEVERKNPKGHYCKENCELCCYWCNNAKSDVFTEKEFISIGKSIGKVIKTVIK